MKHTIRTGRLTRALACCAGMAFANASSAAIVAVFNDPGYVDAGTEASIEAALTGLGHTVTTFSGISAASFNAAAASANLILFPHLAANLGTGLAEALALVPSAITAVQNYVNQGGAVVAVGGDAHTLLNSLFYGPTGNVLSSSGLFDGGSFLQPAAAGTPYATAPATLAGAPALPGVDTGLNFFAFTPPGSLPLYMDSTSGTDAGSFNSVTVFVDDIGSGSVAYLSWNWLNAVANDANGGWNPLLDLVVNDVAAPPAIVPLPATAPLLFGALALFGVVRRRTHRRSGTFA